MFNTIGQNTQKGQSYEFDEFFAFDPQDLYRTGNDWEVSARHTEHLSQPKEIGTSSITELVTRMEQMVTNTSLEKNLKDFRKATTQLQQQIYQHGEQQQSKMTADEMKALFDFPILDLSYDPLSANLTPEQEAMEIARTRDSALGIFGPAVMGRDSNDNTYGFYSAPNNGLETALVFEITDREFQRLLDSSFGEVIEKKSMAAEGSMSNQHPQKRRKMSTKVSQAQVTLQPSDSTYCKVPSFEDTENRAVVQQLKRTGYAQSRRAKKTTKNVFEAVARSSQNPASPPKPASSTPKSAHWSWGHSSTSRPIAPSPSPQEPFEDAFNTPRGAQALTSQGFQSRPTPRGHQRQKSNQSNLFFAGSVQPSSTPTYKAGSAQRKQGTEPSATFFTSPEGTSTFEVPRTPTQSRFFQTHSSSSANMSEKRTPTQTPGTPTPRGPASLPRRPPGPLPNFKGPPIRKPNFGPLSPAPTSVHEFARITFPTRLERDEGVQLLQGVGKTEENNYKVWYESHPRFKEMRVSSDLNPESMTIELCGPIGSNVRGALSSLFDGRYPVSARLG